MNRCKQWIGKKVCSMNTFCSQLQEKLKGNKVTRYWVLNMQKQSILEICLRISCASRFLDIWWPWTTVFLLCVLSVRSYYYKSWHESTWQTNHCGIDLSWFVETITCIMWYPWISACCQYDSVKFPWTIRSYQREHVSNQLRESNLIITIMYPQQMWYSWGNMMEYLGNKLQNSTHIFRVDHADADWTDEEFSPPWGPCGEDIWWNIHLHHFHS